MSNEVMIIKNVRGYKENETVMLNLEDVSRGLGFTQIAKSGNEVVRWERVNKYLVEFGIPTSGDKTFIPENIFYRLCFKAKNETAQKFQTFVCDEVLPTIRKTGGYVNSSEQFVNSYFSDLDDNAKMFLVTTLDSKKKLMEKIEQDKPLVEFANQVSNSCNSIDMSAFAKIIKDENIKIGRNKLYEWLRFNKYLRYNNEPYQKYIDMDIFTVIEESFRMPYGIKTSNKCLITGKGQLYLVEKLREEFNK
jgi:anti-repressor protein